MESNLLLPNGCEKVKYILMAIWNIIMQDSLPKGYTQQASLDYHKVFAPPAKLTTVQYLISNAGEKIGILSI